MTPKLMALVGGQILALTFLFLIICLILQV